MEFRGVQVQKTLDFFGRDNSVALVVFKDIDYAAVAAPKFTELLLEGQEKVLVEPPVQKGAETVHVLDFQDGEFADSGKRLVERGDGAVLGIHVDEYIQDSSFFPVSSTRPPVSSSR